MSLADALFEKLRLLFKRHRPQLDVRDAGSRAQPDTATIVGNQVKDLVVRQITPAGKVLAAIERTGVVINADDTLPRAVPHSPIAGSCDATCLTLRRRTRRGLHGGWSTGIGELVKRPELL